MNRVLFFCLLLAVIIGCAKNDSAPNMAGDMPMSELVASKEVNITKYTNGYSGDAIGFEFKAKADGHITGLGCAFPTIGNYLIQLYKVDTVNKTGTLIASNSVNVTASDTANFKFKYSYLTSKVAIAKGNYYRAAISGNSSSAYDYMTFSGTYKLPLTLASQSNVLFTKGVTGTLASYPDVDYTTFMWPADVVVQFP